MRIGVIFPQTEIGTDPLMVRDFAQAAEELGYSHLQAYDHVVGADTRYARGGTAPTTCTACSTSPWCSSATWRP